MADSSGPAQPKYDPSEEIKLVVEDDVHSTAVGEEPTTSGSPFFEVLKYTIVIAVIAGAGGWAYVNKSKLLDEYPRAENGPLEPDPPPYLKTAGLQWNNLVIAANRGEGKKGYYAIRPQELIQSKAYQSLPKPTQQRLRRLMEELICADLPLENVEEALVVNEMGNPPSTVTLIRTKTPIDLELWKKTKQHYETAGQAELYSDLIGDGRRLTIFCLVSNDLLACSSRVDVVYELIKASKVSKDDAPELNLPKGFFAASVPDLSANGRQAPQGAGGRAAGGASTTIAMETGPRTNLDPIRQIIRRNMALWSNTIKNMEASIVATDKFSMEVKGAASDPGKAQSLANTLSGVRTRFLRYLVSGATPDLPTALDQVKTASAAEFKANDKNVTFAVELDAKLIDVLTTIIPKEHRPESAPKG